MRLFSGVSHQILALFAALVLGSQFAVAQEGGAPPYEYQLNDAQLVDIVIALNEMEVETSEVGAGKAQATEVREYAQRMVEEHKQALASLQREDLTPEPNEVSQTLRNTNRGVTDQLEQAPAEGFDKKFMEIQISLHQSALNLLDYTVIPLIQDNGQRQQLIEMRNTVDKHLRDAWKLYRGME